MDKLMDDFIILKHSDSCYVSRYCSILHTFTHPYQTSSQAIRGQKQNNGDPTQITETHIR